MKNEKQTTDDTVGRQAAIAAEGLRRHRAIGAAPASVNSEETIEQSLQRIADEAENAAEQAEREFRSATDGVLNWAGGERVLSPTPGAASFPAAVAGVGTASRASTTTTPKDFGHSLTSAPNGRGGCMTFEEIMRHSGR